jgi:hypothetical protein
MTINELQNVLKKLKDLENLLNDKISYIIENIYSQYKPELVPLADGTIKDGAIDTGDMWMKTKITVDYDTNNPTFINFILDTTDYFKYVDGRNIIVPNGTRNMKPREFLNILTSDPEIEEAITDLFGELLVSIITTEGEDLILDENIGFSILGGIL